MTAALPARAEETEAARQARWAHLEHAIFGNKPVQDGSEAIVIEAPLRAEDAAIVPLEIHLDDAMAKKTRRLYLVIDNNPSPLAGVFHFGPAGDARDIATRVRVDDYTYIHAVAEMDDGTLLAAQRFIKAAGGCSAPASKDQTAALKRLGKMKFALTAPAAPGVDSAQLLISHPNNSGLQMDQLTRQYIPADFIQRLRVSYAGEEVFTLDTDITLSENPMVRFSFVAPRAGELRAELEDSHQRHFDQHWPVSAAVD
jgi:sulfur-oxidizing protein SoxY